MKRSVSVISGTVFLLTFAGTGVAAPANDNFTSRTSLSGSSGKVRGTNVFATKEAGEPDIYWNPGGHSVWWKWTALQTATVTFLTDGSDFDTLLGVYTGSSVAGLQLVADDDESGVDSASNVVFSAVMGQEYQIAVDGYDGEWGSIVLSWYSSPPCGDPPGPSGPWPPDGASEIPTSMELEWDRAAQARPKTIYGRDDRLDIYQVKDPEILKAWDSTVALVSRSQLWDNQDGTFTLPGRTAAEDIGLCPGERFRDQPDPAWCSGFLVGSDLVATAGHCVGTSFDCDDVAFVFGFRMLDASTPVLTFPASQIYYCKGIVASRTDDYGADGSIVQLDREVPDHKALRIRRSGMVLDDQPLIMIGYPMGLPAKVAGGAWVEDNSPDTYFVANLDAYGGNSGSLVLNASTLVAEGILARGEEDFIDNGDCLISLVCGDLDCSGEDVTRATDFDHLVPQDPDAEVHQVYFGPCGNLALLGETAETIWSVKDLDLRTTYCWQIITKGECGQAEGPIWTFTTAGPTLFRRGDLSEDGSVDLNDAIGLLFYLFLSLEPSCQKSANVDGSARIDLADVVVLLEYLFLDGDAPPSPFSSCGADLAPDGLTCLGHRACN